MHPGRRRSRPQLPSWYRGSGRPPTPCRRPRGARTPRAWEARENRPVNREAVDGPAGKRSVPNA